MYVYLKKESLDTSLIYIHRPDSEVFTMALISFALLRTNKNNPQQNTCANQFTTFPDRHSVVGKCMLTPQRLPWHHKHLQAPPPWYEWQQTRFTFLPNQSQEERNTDTQWGGARRQIWNCATSSIISLLLTASYWRKKNWQKLFSNITVGKHC